MDSNYLRVELTEEQKAERAKAQEFMQEFVTQLVARGLTAWPEFTIPGTSVVVPAGKVPGTLRKINGIYQLRKS